ncbi:MULTISPECIES: hypothetical protein [Haloferax]|uniref:Nucleic acid-binding protein, contains PIN domain protein n=2 Tax=Haloferax TaxID=2251 RepID=A0A6G1Z7E2_9EURY|nr:MULTISPECIES: hypothetical protein [Haloferax]KAB1184827.1 hypothetical protein Hfx1149_17355 [Haloferax sp. CBA1149]MRW82462.1 hypothetical protein [Haloferax marinisediminis]
MLVVDTSAFISLAIGGVLDSVVNEFDVVTTEAVVDGLEATAQYDDRHGDGANSVLESIDYNEVVDVTGDEFVTSRINQGEASCVTTVRELDAVFLITDDYRALPELQQLVDADAALSPIVLRALVKRGTLGDDAVKAAFETIAERRDWLGAPIYRYTRNLFE